MKGDDYEYNWEVKECMTAKQSCESYGQTWMEPDATAPADERGWCMWSLFKKVS